MHKSRAKTCDRHQAFKAPTHPDLLPIRHTDIVHVHVGPAVQPALCWCWFGHRITLPQTCTALCSFPYGREGGAQVQVTPLPPAARGHHIAGRSNSGGPNGFAADRLFVFGLCCQATLCPSSTRRWVLGGGGGGLHEGGWGTVSSAVGQGGGIA